MRNLRPSLFRPSAASRGRSPARDGATALAFTRGVRQCAVAIAMSMFLSGTVSSVASELQPPQAGAQPLRDRLAVVEAESKSLEAKLTAPGLQASEKEELLKQRAKLAAEKHRLALELKSAQVLARSPYVTFARPPRDAH